MSSSAREVFRILDLRISFRKEGIRDRKMRNEGTGKAVIESGWAWREGADSLNFHYSTLNPLIRF
jgi:hypothetical protein